MAARFTGIPSLPQLGVEEWEYRILNAMKQNLELLTGTRGEQDLSSRALLKSTVSITSAPEPSIRSLSAVGSGFTVGGARVASLADYQQLVQDVQLLLNDVAALRQTVNTLLTQLRT